MKNEESIALRDLSEETGIRLNKKLLKQTKVFNDDIESPAEIDEILQQHKL